MYSNINMQKLGDKLDKKLSNINQEKKPSPNVDKVEISHIPQNDGSISRDKIPTELQTAKQQIVDAIKKDPNVEMYQQIKDQVQSGNYVVDAKTTAKAMVSKGSLDELV